MGLWLFLLRHMGVPEELINLFHTLSIAHGPTPSIRLHRGLRQGSAESVVLYLLLLEPLWRKENCCAGGGGGVTRKPLFPNPPPSLLGCRDGGGGSGRGCPTCFIGCSYCRGSKGGTRNGLQILMAYATRRWGQ